MSILTQNTLLDAMHNGDLEKVKELFPLVDPNKLDVYEHPLLLYALFFCRANIIEYIADNTDANYVDKNGRTALMNYIQDPDRSESDTENDEVCIKTITPILKHVDINFKDKDGYTALNVVLSKKDIDIEVVKLLLDYGADPLICDDITDYCPLRIAFGFDDIRYVELMLKNVKNISINYLYESINLNSNDMSYDIIEMLLPFIEDINVPINLGNRQTLLDFVISNNLSRDIIELLVLSGAHAGPHPV